MTIVARTVEPNHNLLFTKGCKCAPTAPPSFSRKDAKLLAIHAQCIELSSAVCPEIMSFAPDRRVESEMFWFLLTQSQAPVTEDLRELHVATVVLLHHEMVAQCNQSLKMTKKVFRALQAAAAALVELLAPGVMRRPGSHVFEKAKPHIRAMLCACCVPTGWVFFALIPNVMSIPNLEPALRPPSVHYLSRPRVVNFAAEDGRLHVEHGAAVHILWLNVRLEYEHNISADVSPDDFLLTMLSMIFDSGAPEHDLNWARRLFEFGDPIVILTKVLGMTHPERPFAASSAIIVLEGADVVEMVKVAGKLGHDWPGGIDNFTVPVSFPPYLSDTDLRLQHAHCRLVVSAPGAIQAAAEATQGVAKELLGDSMALLDIEEATLRRQLDAADQLVRDALEAVRAAHSARKASESLAAKILDDIIDKAWYKIKLRHEWEVREAKVRSWAQHRQRTSKNKARRKAHQVSDSAMAASSDHVADVIEELQQRTIHYRHAAACINSLAELGLAELTPVSSVELGNGDAKPTVLVQLTPPQGAAPSARHSLPVQQRNRRHAKQSWFEVLDQVSLRDREFGVAHKEEAELKLALEMSLHDGIGEEDQTAEVLNDRPAQDPNARASGSVGGDIALQ